MFRKSLLLSKSFSMAVNTMKLSNIPLSFQDEFDFRFLYFLPSRTALGPTKPPIQWVPGALSLRVRRPGCEADHSPSSSAEVKE